jgi:hypothetical protein
MVKYRRQRFFASAAKGTGTGKWSNEDWQYALVLAGFILLVYYLAESYKPGEFVQPYMVEDLYYEEDQG